jgi:hypothetical protein
VNRFSPARCGTLTSSTSVAGPHGVTVFVVGFATFDAGFVPVLVAMKRP